MSELIHRYNSILVLVSFLLTVALTVHFIKSGLWRRYRFFSLFLGFAIFRIAAFAVMPFSRRAYGNFFIATEAINLLLYVLVTLELYGLLFERYPGIRSFSRWVTVASLSLSLLLAGVSLQPDVVARSLNSRLDYLLIAERGVVSGLAFLILLMSLFLAWYPIILPRNLVSHAILFAVYFLAKGAVLLVRNLGRGTEDRIFSDTIGVIGSVCLFAWLVRMRPAGEFVMRVVGHQWNRAEEDRLIRQLEQVNAALARATRE